MVKAERYYALSLVRRLQITIFISSCFFLSQCLYTRGSFARRVIGVPVVFASSQSCSLSSSKMTFHICLFGLNFAENQVEVYQAPNSAIGTMEFFKTRNLFLKLFLKFYNSQFRIFTKIYHQFSSIFFIIISSRNINFKSSIHRILLILNGSTKRSGFLVNSRSSGENSLDIIATCRPRKGDPVLSDSVSSLFPRRVNDSQTWQTSAPFLLNLPSNRDVT